MEGYIPLLLLKKKQFLQTAEHLFWWFYKLPGKIYKQNDSRRHVVWRRVKTPGEHCKQLLWPKTWAAPSYLLWISYQRIWTSAELISAPPMIPTDMALRFFRRYLFSCCLGQEGPLWGLHWDLSCRIQTPSLWNLATRCTPDHYGFSIFSPWISWYNKLLSRCSAVWQDISRTFHAWCNEEVGL